MSDYPRGFRDGFFLRCWLAVSDSLSITPALPVTSLFSCRRRSIALLRLPARPSPRRAPAFVTAITLSRSLRRKMPLASLQQTATRSRATAGRLAGFPIFGRECRILVRAHGSVAPGSSCPGGDLTPLRGAARSGSAQTQRVYRRPTLRPPCFFFSRLASAVSRPFGSRVSALLRLHGETNPAPAGTLTAIHQWRHGPFWRCHNGPFARRHQHINGEIQAASKPDALGRVTERSIACEAKFLLRRTIYRVVSAHQFTSGIKASEAHLETLPQLIDFRAK